MTVYYENVKISQRHSMHAYIGAHYMMQGGVREKREKGAWLEHSGFSNSIN